MWQQYARYSWDRKKEKHCRSPVLSFLNQDVKTGSPDARIKRGPGLHEFGNQSDAEEKKSVCPECARTLIRCAVVWVGKSHFSGWGKATLCLESLGSGTKCDPLYRHSHKPCLSLCLGISLTGPRLTTSGIETETLAWSINIIYSFCMFEIFHIKKAKKKKCSWRGIPNVIYIFRVIMCPMYSSGGGIDRGGRVGQKGWVETPYFLHNFSVNIKLL